MANVMSALKSEISRLARKEAKQEQRLTDEHAAKQFRDRDREE